MCDTCESQWSLGNIHNSGIKELELLSIYRWSIFITTSNKIYKENNSSSNHCTSKIKQLKLFAMVLVDCHIFNVIIIEPNGCNISCKQNITFTAVFQKPHKLIPEKLT